MGEIKPDCAHADGGASYLNFHARSEGLRKRGAKQRHCANCQLWHWSDEDWKNAYGTKKQRKSAPAAQETEES